MEEDVLRTSWEPVFASWVDAVDCFEKNKKAKKRKFKNIDGKIIRCLDPRKTKMAIDFNDRKSASIKSFSVTKRHKIKVATRFMSGKVLGFAKLSLKSFNYDIAEIFRFPTQVFAEIYKKYSIEKVFVYHILTGTDSTALQFIFISDPNSDLPEEKFRDIIFEVIVATKIDKRFDSSYEFWDIFGFRKKSRIKKLGYFEIENFDNPCLVTIAVNPKEYLKVLKNLKLNKNHKGIKKGSSGMDFENFANQIKS